MNTSTQQLAKVSASSAAKLVYVSGSKMDGYRLIVKPHAATDYLSVYHCKPFTEFRAAQDFANKWRKAITRSQQA